MKLVRFLKAGVAAWGIVEGNTAYGVVGSVYGNAKKGGPIGRLNSLKLLAPCEPKKIVGAALNYHSLLRDHRTHVPVEPVIFLKAPTSVIATGEEIVVPPLCEQVMVEGEIGVVIKKKGRNIPPEEVDDYILGYTCFNDLTGSNVEGRDLHLARSKSFDTFCSVGPAVVTDLDPTKTRVLCRLNGKTVQDYPVSDMVMDIPHTVSLMSKIMSLEPGDGLMMGTSSGSQAVKPGDIVEIEIPEIGMLKNRVVAG